MQIYFVFKYFKCKRCDKLFVLKLYLNKYYEFVCIKDGIEFEIGFVIFEIFVFLEVFCNFDC